jgi:PIN domain nuclease of toxin-antitoxin system
MKLLLDTQSFLWFISGDPKLSKTARQLIETVDNQSYISMASLWEMAIKISLGKLTLDKPFETMIPYQLMQNGIEILPIEFLHVAVITNLPFHHRDPFDRLIIAQASVEGLPVISSDEIFDAYGVRRLW